MKSAKAYIQKLKQIILEAEYASNTKGCSKKEITHWDTYAACGRLPELYREFLLAMGKNIAGTYLGSYLFYTDFLSEIQIKAHQLAENEHIQLPPSAFFFATFDYVYYYYFLTDESNPNPPIYLFSQKQSPKMVFQSLEKFLAYEYGEEGCDELL